MVMNDDAYLKLTFTRVKYKSNSRIDGVDHVLRCTHNYIFTYEIMVPDVVLKMFPKKSYIL